MKARNPDYRGEPKLTRRLIRSRFPTARSSTPTRYDEFTAEYMDAWFRDFIKPARGRDIWVFGYGSLMWTGKVGAGEPRAARLYGLHRRFCLWLWAYKGDLRNPCLMLALDHGGCCDGVVFRMPSTSATFQKIWDDELNGDGYRPRWVKARTADGPVIALTFTINRRGERYSGHLPESEIAAYIASSCGSNGACAEYLRRTLKSMERLCISDGHLRRLERLVSARLAPTEGGHW